MSGSDLRQRLAAIMAADVAGYSRLMALDERATVAALDAARGAFRSQIERHQGRVIDMAGDSVLAVFDTATGAVSAALAVQRELDASAGSVTEDRRMRFRIGVHLGDVIEKADGTVYGDGVNIAARLESLAEPGGIAVSDAVKGAVRGNMVPGFVDRGEQRLKNIPDPVNVFSIRMAGAGSTGPTIATRKQARNVILFVAALAIVAGTYYAWQLAVEERPATAPIRLRNDPEKVPPIMLAQQEREAVKAESEKVQVAMAASEPKSQAAAPAAAAVASAAPAAEAHAAPDSLYEQALAMEQGGRAADAVRVYRRAARAGSGKAAKRLGEIFDKGVAGVSRDYAESLQWYEVARQLGEPVNAAAAR